MRRILFFTLVTFAFLVPAVPSFAEELFTAETIGDFGNVTVMEVSGNYDEMTPDGKVNSLPRELIAQEFYRTHKDEYDFLTIFSTFDFKLETEAVAFYLGVKNDTLGIGSQIFDNGHFFGSGGKLQGTVDMGNIAKLASSPLDPGFEFSLDILGHEMLHRWSAFVKFRDSSGNLSTALLGRDGSHWSYLLDTKGSAQYGNSWRDNGDGTFTSVAARKYYSPLDLYLMGMIDSSKVPPMLLIDNPSIDPTKVSGAGDTISGTPRYVTIEDIISAEGERVPKAEDAQKQFKMAFILVTSGTLTRDDLNGIENIRKGFLARFSILTDGQGLVQITSTENEDLAANPGVLPPETTPRTLPPSIDEGVSWLLAAQKEAGNWGRLETAERDTAKAITVLKNFPIASEAQPRGLQWLAESGAKNTDYLSAKIAALASAGQEFSTLIDSLLPRQNLDGGWGSDRNYLSDPIDTCSALKALLAANSTAAAVGKGADYLLARQNPDGGWGFQVDAPSNVLVTAEVAAILQRLPAMSSLATAVNKATAFLLNRQNTDGGFGSSPSTVYETALAYRALSGVITDGTVLGGAINYLYSSQSNDGSWLQDPYSTALAVEVLHLSGDKAPEPPTSGTVSGTVVDGVTQQSLGGATVNLQDDSSITTVTAAAGSFSLSDVPQGSQTIVISLDGYAPYTQAANITAGSIVDLGTISLAPNPTTGMIKGVITAAATGEPIPEVTLTITGSFEGTVLTKEDGRFAIGNIIPGSITITASKTGYKTVSATGTVTEGSVLSFNPQLTILASPPTTGSVAGSVLDAATGQPLTGVSVILQSDPTITATTDSSGNFTLSGIPHGNQKVEFALSGYATSAIGVNVSAGSIVNLGAVVLSANPPASAIRGTVSDAFTGQPLSGATVTIGGAFSGTTVTGVDGSFAVSGVPPGAVTVTAAKSGYYPVIVTGSVTAGGELFLNPQLAAIPPQATTGTMTGKVVDALTKEPLIGVTVTLQSNTSINAISNATGVLTLAEIPPGTQRVDFSLPGYATSSITVDIVAGILVDIRSFPLSANPTTGMIRGTITDAAGGQPLSGVTVTVTGSFSGSAVTGEEGSFEFSEIPPGNVELTASKPGYHEVTGAGTIVAGGMLYFSPQMTIVPPQPTTGTVTGKIVDASTGQPLSGVSVVVESDMAIHSETDATGSFMLSDIPAGLQSISFSLLGYSAVSAKMEIAAGFVIDLGTLPLSPNPTTSVLKGSITDAESGQPIVGATISFSGSSDGSAVTELDGTFLVPEVAPGEISITVSKAGYYPMAGDVTVISGSVLFLQLQLAAIPPQSTTGTIMGRIVDGTTSEPLSGVAVILKSDPSIASMTDAAGGFVLADIPPGNQAFEFSMSGYATSTATVEIAAGYIVNLGTLPLFSNPTTGMIKGRITEAAGGQPLSGVTVTVTGSFSGNFVTGVDGSFVLDGITPGSVTITASKAGYYSVAGTGTVTAGAVLFFDPRLTISPPKSSTGALTGKVLDAMTNKPIPGAMITIEGGSSASTDEQGIYLIDNIAPGAYYIIISAVDHVTVHYTMMVMEGVTTNMQTVYLTPLLQATTVAGNVIDVLTGTPIEGAEVLVVGTNVSVKTDSDGAYSLSGINLLDFYLKASATGYDSLVQNISSVSHGFYKFNFQLNPSQTSSLKLVSLRPDSPNYAAHSPVVILAEVLNSDTQLLRGTVSASIIDADGHATDYFQATFVDGDGIEKGLFEFEPGVSTTISLPWATKNQAPGTYRVVVRVTEGETGVTFGKLVAAEKAAAFTIDATEAVEILALTPMPRFANYGAAEQIGVQASVVNRSNVPVLLGVVYEWLSPTGLLLHVGSGEVSMLPAEGTKSVLFDSFQHTFTESGDHPIQVRIVGGPLPGNLLGGGISVAPGTRIEPSQSLTPSTVIPDGDKRLRMNIHLKGVVLK
jgi:hypothetical protein